MCGRGKWCIAGLLAGAMSAAGAAHAANLVQNPDFSLGNTGFTTTYTYNSDLGPEGRYYVGTNPALYQGLAKSYGDHTTGTGLMLIVNGAPTANQIIWRETLAVTPGTSYNFAGFIASWGAAARYDPNAVDPSPAILQFQVNGTPLGANYNVSVVPGQWNSFSRSWDSGASSQAILTIVDLNTARVGNDVTIDDLTFTALPEPATLALAGLGAITLLCRRRPAAR